MTMKKSARAASTRMTDGVDHVDGLDLLHGSSLRGCWLEHRQRRPIFSRTSSIVASAIGRMPVGAVLEDAVHLGRVGHQLG